MKMSFHLFRCVSWMVGMAATLTAHAQPLPDSAATWQLGLRVHALSLQDRTMDTEEHTTSSRSSDVAIQAFGLRFMGKRTFLRAGIGCDVSHDSTQVMHRETGQVLSTGKSSGLDILTELGLGYEFPASRKWLLRRLHFRVGLTLNHRSQLLFQAHRASYDYDSLGTVTESHQLMERKGYLELNAAAFFQVEFRIGKQFRMGVEWRNGPSYSWWITTYTTAATVPQVE